MDSLIFQWQFFLFLNGNTYCGPSLEQVHFFSYELFSRPWITVHKQCRPRLDCSTLSVQALCWKVSETKYILWQYILIFGEIHNIFCKLHQSAYAKYCLLNQPLDSLVYKQKKNNDTICKHRNAVLQKAATSNIELCQAKKIFITSVTFFFFKSPQRWYIDMPAYDFIHLLELMVCEHHS